MPQTELRCKGCNRRPSDIEEYVEGAREEETTPDEYVRLEEGTLNPHTGLFWCTECYVRAGCPLGTA